MIDGSIEKSSGSMDNKSKIQLICNSVWQKNYVDPTIMIYLVYDPKKNIDHGLKKTKLGLGPAPASAALMPKSCKRLEANSIDLRLWEGSTMEYVGINEDIWKLGGVKICQDLNFKDFNIIQSNLGI